MNNIITTTKKLTLITYLNKIIIGNLLKKLILHFSLVFLLAFSISEVSAQKQANVWWFGTHAGIDFNTSPPTPLAGLPINTYEGCSSMSDPVTGALIFATDGQSVWYPNGTTVTGGTGLFGASSSASSALIVPNPSNANEWFIFTSNVDPGTGVNHGHNYYVVDRVGATITVGAVNPLLGSTVSTEQLVGLGDGANGYWLVTHGLGNNTFYAFHVSSGGVVTSAPVTSNVGTVIGATHYISSMKANTCQNKIGLTNLSEGIAEVYNFNNATGTVTSLLYSVTGLTNPYGVEFSPQDTYMYYGTLAGQMYQMNMGTGVSSLTGWTAPPNGSGKFGQLQLAPDGKIYVASEDINPTSYVGTISAPDNPFATAGYSATGFTLSTINTTISQLGLPTFSRTFVSSVAAVTPGNGSFCPNVAIPLGFTFSGAVNAATILWSATGGGQTFAPGGATSTNVSPTVTFSTTGTKTVTLTFDDICGNHYTKPMTFTITAPKTPAGTIGCSGNNLTLDNPAVDPDKPNYIWYANSVSNANIIGIGTPVNYAVGSNSAMPTQICLGVSSGSPTTTTGSNSIASSNTLPGASQITPQTSATFDVLANQLVLKSFNIGFRFAGTYSVTTTIKNGGGTTMYTNTANIVQASGGTNAPVAVNTTLPAGTGYTIIIGTTPSGQELQRGTWAGATNAGQITYNGFGTGVDVVANMLYDWYNYTATPVCSAPTCYPIGCLLPVKLIEFTGTVVQNNVLLNWLTATELNNDYFEIQRSTDGINFVTIGIIKGHGNSSTINEYTFNDIHSTNGVNYYQLVQHDLNGDLSYSLIIKVIAGTNAASFTVSPNPSIESFNINFKDISGGEFTVLNVLGQTLTHKTIETGTEKISVGAELSKGAYILRFSGANGVYTQLVIKE